MVRVWGNWCGPNWTADQVKPAQAATKQDEMVSCIDNLDCGCREHDLTIRNFGPSFESDLKLQRVAEKILANPFNAVIKPNQYAAANVVAIGMALSKWRR